MASGSERTESPTSKMIKIAVLAVVLLAAGYLFFRFIFGGDGGQLDTAESATLYVCPADGATLSLTPAEFDLKWKAGEVGPPEGTTGRGRGLYVRCPTCSKRVMVVAVKCEKDGTVFRKFTEKDEPAACPKCKWKPAK